MIEGDKELSDLIDHFKEKLPKQDLEQIIEYIDHNERVLALEHLGGTLYETSIPISREEFNKFIHVGEIMDIKPNDWKVLKELVKD